MFSFIFSMFLGTVLLSAGDPSSAPTPAEQTAETASAEPSGVATVVEIKGTVKAVSKDTGETRTLQQGDAIYLNETISAESGASLQMEVADESLFTISENTTIRMDLFDLDESNKDGHLAASVTKGVFRFVSGKVAKVKPENVNIDVPSGTIGIRGTVVLGEIEGEKCLVSLEAEDGDKVQHRIVFSGMVDGQKREVEITKPGFATVIEKRGMAPKPVFELPQENRARFQAQLPPPRYLPRNAEGRPMMNANVRDPEKFPSPMNRDAERRKNPGGPNPPNGPGNGPGFRQGSGENGAQSGGQPRLNNQGKDRAFDQGRPVFDQKPGKMIPAQGENRRQQGQPENFRQNQPQQKPGFFGRLMGQNKEPQGNQRNLTPPAGGNSQNRPPKNPPPANKR